MKRHHLIAIAAVGLLVNACSKSESPETRRQPKKETAKEPAVPVELTKQEPAKAEDPNAAAAAAITTKEDTKHLAATRGNVPPKKKEPAKVNDNAPTLASLQAQLKKVSSESAEATPPVPTERKWKKKTTDSDSIRKALVGTKVKTEKKEEIEKPKKEKAVKARKRTTVPRREPLRKTREEQELEEDSGALPDRAFYNALADWQGAKDCLQASRRRVRLRSGTIRVLYKIAPTGQVLRVKAILPTGPGSREVGRCIEAQAKKVKFPEFEGTKPAKKLARFVWVDSDTTINVVRD